MEKTTISWVSGHCKSIRCGYPAEGKNRNSCCVGLHTVKVEDALIDPKTKRGKLACLVYSRVSKILSVVRP
jgi:hypothetical protein